ncbi:MAG: hypothetical protein O7G31_12770 [Calditrichaeota bacterium]|nr:hypothetical protein [Calditrichota bacterium]
MVQRHHGRVWVESKIGEGSTLSFTLPEEWVSSFRFKVRTHLKP